MFNYALNWKMGSDLWRNMVWIFPWFLQRYLTVQDDLFFLFVCVCVCFFVICVLLTVTGIESDNFHFSNKGSGVSL